MALYQNVTLIMVYKCMKFDENSFKSMKIMAMSVIFSQVHKADNLNKFHYRVTPLV